MNLPTFFRVLAFLSLNLLISLSLQTQAHANAKGTDSNLPLKVLELNFNSEIALEDAHYKIRDLRFKALVNWVSLNSPDVILLVEAWSYRDSKNIASALAEALGYDVNLRLDMGLPGFFYDGDAILAKKSLKMTNPRAIQLPHSAFEWGDGQSWIVELGAVSFAVGSKITLPTGEPFYFYATHLIADADSARADQAAAIVQDARQWVLSDGGDWSSANVILGGDFNSNPDDLTSLAVKNAGFQDTFDVIHPGDSSCTDCEIPTHPWFNPFTLVANQFPSQAGFTADLRDDYLFIHSALFKPQAATLVFTSPLEGVWMSDHYGFFAGFKGVNSTESPSLTPIHDTPENIPATQVIGFIQDLFQCPDPLDLPVDPNSPTCEFQQPVAIVEGARGITVLNQSTQSFQFHIRGPGHIFASSSVKLASGQSAAFSFDTVGEYVYTAENEADPVDGSTARVSGKVWVRKTGY